MIGKPGFAWRLFSACINRSLADSAWAPRRFKGCRADQVSLLLMAKSLHANRTLFSTASVSECAVILSNTRATCTVSKRPTKVREIQYATCNVCVIVSGLKYSRKVGSALTTSLPDDMKKLSPSLHGC